MAVEGSGLQIQGLKGSRLSCQLKGSGYRAPGPEPGALHQNAKGIVISGMTF